MIARLVAVFLALTFAPGCCLMMGNTSTARTLEKGTGEVGLTFGVTTYQFQTSTVPAASPSPTATPTKETVNVAYPVLIPEIPFGIAITDDLQVGGRFAPQSLGFELNTKWRFYHDGPLHVAIAPAVGYQAWLIVQGVGARLPFLITYDIGEHLSFTTEVHGAYTSWGYTDKNFDPSKSDNQNATAWSGNLASFGIGICPEIHTDSFFIRPAFEFNRYQANFSSQFENSFEPFNSYGFMLNIGWVIGKTKKQLDRIEQKIDRLSQPPAPAPAPPPSAPPTAPPPPKRESDAATQASLWDGLPGR